MNSRVYLVLLMLVLSGPKLFGQNIVDSFKVCGLPIRDGIIYKHDRHSYHRPNDEDDGVTILTKCDSVFHFGAGKVLAVHKYEHEDGIYMIVLENGKNEFVSYSNLSYVAIRKGDYVEKGTWLGLTAISDEGNEKQLDLMILTKTKEVRSIPFKQVKEYIRCRVSCEDGSSSSFQL